MSLKYQNGWITRLKYAKFLPCFYIFISCWKFDLKHCSLTMAALVCVNEKIVVISVAALGGVLVGIAGTFFVQWIIHIRSKSTDIGNFPLDQSNISRQTSKSRLLNNVLSNQIWAWVKIYIAWESVNLFSIPPLRSLQTPGFKTQWH